MRGHTCSPASCACESVGQGDKRGDEKGPDGPGGLRQPAESVTAGEAVAASPTPRGQGSRC